MIIYNILPYIVQKAILQEKEKILYLIKIMIEKKKKKNLYLKINVTKVCYLIVISKKEIKLIPIINL